MFLCYVLNRVKIDNTKDFNGFYKRKQFSFPFENYGVFCYVEWLKLCEFIYVNYVNKNRFNMKLIINGLLLSALALSITACNKTNNNSTDITTKTTSSSNPTSASATATTGTVIINTVTGQQQIANNVSPIAVFDLTVLQNLSALDVPVQGIPDTPAPRAELLKLSAIKPESKVVGTLFEPNLEALNALKPKAVFVGGRMAEKANALSSIAPVYNLTIDTNDIYQSSKLQLDELGKVFNKQTLAKQRQDEIDTAVATTKKATANKGNALIVLVNGNKLSAYGANSRFGYIHSAFGIPQVSNDIKTATHGQPISFEFIQKTNPDWLIVLDRASAIGEEGISAKTVLNNPVIATTKAWQKQQVIYLSADSYLAPGGYYQMLKDSQLVTDAFNKTE